jgi:hypothetical protein
MFTIGEQVSFPRGTLYIGESRDGMTRLYQDPADPRSWKCWMLNEELKRLIESNRDWQRERDTFRRDANAKGYTVRVADGAAYKNPSTGEWLKIETWKQYQRQSGRVDDRLRPEKGQNDAL